MFSAAPITWPSYLFPLNVQSNIVLGNIVSLSTDTTDIDFLRANLKVIELDKPTRNRLEVESLRIADRVKYIQINAKNKATL